MTRKVEEQGKAIAAGGSHGLLIDRFGGVWAWGRNIEGQLGTGNNNGSSVSTPVPSLTSGVASIAGGNAHSLALKYDGTVWAWGNNASGQLGNGCAVGTNCSNSNVPVRVVGLSKVVSIGAGYDFSYAIESDGSVWAWGDGTYGQTAGYGTTGTPRQIRYPLANGGAAIAQGPEAYHALVIGRANPNPYPTSITFPLSSVGSVGSSTTVSMRNSGSAPMSIYGVSLVGPGADMFKLVADDCSNTTVASEFFDPNAGCDVVVRYEPTAVGAATAYLRFQSNVPGGETLFTLTGNALPSAVSGSSFATTPNPLFATGANPSGELGTAGIVNASSPVPVKTTGAFVAASAGALHSVGLRPDGTVWDWGSNTYGQLGTGDSIDAHQPVQVQALNGVVSVSAGAKHTLALRSDGTLWAWGDNTSGELGNGTLTGPALTPVQAPYMTDVTAISAGDSFSLALRRDGTVDAVGAGSSGQLGTGGGYSTDNFVGAGLTGVVAIAAGGKHGLALKSDGTVWAWGNNFYGQVGNGCTIGTNCSNSLSPVQVTGLSNVVAIAAGYAHSLALKADGTVWAWGYNGHGQLGNNTVTASSVPVKVSGLGFMTQIAGGYNYSLAVDNQGSVWGWGDNTNGQLGVGSTTDQHLPKMAAARQGGELLAQGSEGGHSLFIGQPFIHLNSANPVIFPSESPGVSSPSQSVVLLNTGILPLVFGQASIVGSDGDEFTFAGDGCSGTTVASGATCSIWIRYDPKINAKAVATLRIPSNAPTGPMTVTLDPPAVSAAGTVTTAGTVSTAGTKGTAHAAPLVTCSHPRAKRGRLVLTCRLSSAVRHGKHRLTVRLMRGAHSAAVGSSRTTSARTFTITLSLPHGLKPGGYTLMIATTGGGSAIEPIAVPRVRPRR